MVSAFACRTVCIQILGICVRSPEAQLFVLHIRIGESLPWSVHWGQRGPLCGSACWEAREDSLRAEESVEQFLACMDRMACQLNGTELLPSR